MQFNITDTYQSSEGHIIIPFDKDHIDELQSIDIAGVDIDQIIRQLSNVSGGDKIIISNSIVIHMLELAQDACYAGIKKAFTSIGKNLQSNTIDVICSHRSYAEIELKAIINGLALSDYNINLYQTSDKKENRHLIFNIVSAKKWTDADKLVQSSIWLSEAQKLVMDIVNAPANKLIPEQLADLVVTRIKNANVHVKVLDQNEIKEEQLHTVVAVNRGSEDPARFVIIEYRASDSTENTPHFGLVGKGITFDTGGISLKKSQNMHYMKCDLGGGAAVFGAMYMLAREKPKAHITAIVPITENSIGTRAIKPGDVINSHSGKTIEIIDTDAEGRLILADGLSYMINHYKTDYLIDLATLTGSMVQALGYQAGGVFTNNDSLAEKLCRSGDQVSERLWRMPLWDSYKKDISSEVADVRNFSGRPLAGSISAAKFLEVFTNEHPAWAHLDIAGVAFGENPYTSEKAGTGYGPHLIYQWIINTIVNHN